MAIQTTYTNARTNLAKFCEEVTTNQEVVFINRQGHEPVALISASELARLTETAYLLKSPKNAKRLLTALKRAQERTLKPEPIEQFVQEIGLDKKK